ncbi:DUF885 domain-containing protein [Corynebacterium pyruviciproducens]|uniref:DUF885 domain-containing protein n=1 Tax=Corynebacterium pyruviciproducens TaxID=598660 RepID=UPI0023F2B18F|nr:DUF885 domain-containing protein [Corynebacterium pyruviciproducens]MDH4658947.1 DUF885 domain-containing protein [Corynebacterium pyruviciproducens]MDK7214251.1 DUF885 domain-containing protein [Corynebacterium pyruviciproducens]
MTEPRTQSLLDSSCDDYIYSLAELIPTAATDWGIPGMEGELQDFSPEYFSAVADRARELLADVDALEDETDADDDADDFDDVDRVTAKVLRDRLRLELDLHHDYEDMGNLNNIDSPVQDIRMAFQNMPADEDAMRSRLSKVPAALAGYQQSLSEAAVQGRVAPIRQIEEVKKQCDELAEPGSLLETCLAPEAEIEAAKAAFGSMRQWLSENLAPHAPKEDACGLERYERFSKLFVGFNIDFEEAYNWGLDSLQEIVEKQQKVAEALYGEGTSVERALENLEEDPRYQLHGTAELKKWMQKTANQAIAQLNGTEFEIPEEMATIQCLIDPAGTGGIYYTAPTDDFSRPGRMWWAVPEGQETFHTWQEKTTVFHEGVPGHHMQLGTQIASDTLNAWRRLACWNSGHGEGWALYAESLMEELGYLDDPGYVMGYLDSQRLRAARVVLDIGVHLGLATPEGGRWDASYARTFLQDNTAMADANVRFELNRYLGWPGQAPSYALGQRAWRELRHDVTATGVTPQEFHSRALALGSIPMNILREEMIENSEDED